MSRKEKRWTLGGSGIEQLLRKYQKFLNGERVRIKATLPRSRRHFPCDTDAIVLGTYRSKYSRGPSKEYSLLLLDTTGKPIGISSWYEEGDLTLISKDRLSGELLYYQYIETIER